MSFRALSRNLLELFRSLHFSRDDFSANLICLAINSEGDAMLIKKFVIYSLVVLGTINQSLMARESFEIETDIEQAVIHEPEVNKTEKAKWLTRNKKIGMGLLAFAGLTGAGAGLASWLINPNGGTLDQAPFDLESTKPMLHKNVTINTFSESVLSPYFYSPESEGIVHLGTNQVRNSKGIIKIARPSASKSGDLLVLFLHRTDDDLPLYVDGWKRVAECYKSGNGKQCATKADCTKWHNSKFCKKFGSLGNGHDLAQAVFVKTVGPRERNIYRFNLNRGAKGKPGWAILTALRGADNDDPVRDWSHTGCDKEPVSVFPSVYGVQGDLVLLSQSYDDAIAKSKFRAPDGATTLGYISGGDEAGFLFGGYADRNGDTGEMRTNGKGSFSCKDALISLTIRPKN